MTRIKKQKIGSIQANQAMELPSLNIIRTETVLSKLPIHNLSKKGINNIHITQSKDNGEIELYWKVSPSRDHGEPRQLAYKLDTIVINRRIDEYGKALPKMLRIGSRRDVCKELNLSENGTNFAGITKAMNQNAGAFITTKLSYKSTDGTERELEAGFTRYSVIFTGERLPNGEKADAIYVLLNDIFWELLKNAPARPLDYSYLKALPPAAQRFYEIIGYKVFPAMKYNHKQAKLLYSEFCLYSAQNRYYDYDHFKKQMYKTHKPHLDSGYINAVEYEQTRDANGKLDWMMIYTLGEKAQAEYKAFNSRLTKVDAIDIKPTSRSEQAKPTNSTTSKQAKEPVLKKAVAKEKQSEPSAALKLVQSFHKQARGTDDYKPYRGSKEESQAEALLATYGLEKAQYILIFAIAQARKTNFEMRTFGAVFQYVDEAVAEQDRREQELARQRAQEDAARKAADKQLQTLSKKEYKTLYEKAKKQILSDLPSLASQPESEMLQSLIKSEMLGELNKKKR